ncbi:titin homolog isoform X2 [Cloeon dipterum]|uniref:titin homolog isoform X2 n=1 Tax=Cloeon dipterum TaxID=197152 RepID=UPI0032203124
MATDVGQLPPQPDDVEQINDEEVLRRMWQAAEDFGRKKEIRARMYKLREKRLRDFYTTGEVLKDVQSADPHAAIREETPKRGGTTYRELVVGELRAGDHFDIREKPAEQTKPAELIESSDGSHQLQQQAVTVIFESTTTTTTTSGSLQEMLDSRSEAESPPASRTSSRRSSKSSPSRGSDSRRSSTSEGKMISSPTREVKVTTSSYVCSSSSPSREVEIISTESSGSRRTSDARVSSTPPREVIRSPSRESGSRCSSAAEVKLASISTSEVKLITSSFESTASRVSSSPSREVLSSSYRRNSDARASEAIRSPAGSRRSSTTESRMTSDEVKSRSTPQREIFEVKMSSNESQELKSSLRRSSETRKSSSPTREMSKSPVRSDAGSPTRQVSSRKSSVSENKEDAQFSTFTSVTLVRQQEGGSRVTSPNRRKLSSASKARRAGTPSASPPCSPSHEEERHDESSDEEVATVRSKVEDAAKPKSILRTPEQRKKSITDEAKKPEPKKAEPQQVKRAVAEVKLTRKAAPEKKPVTDAKKTLRRRSREQVEDSSERDSSCSPVRTRTLSKSKVSPKQETAPATSTTTSTLKRPTKLPILNNAAAKKQPEPAAGKHEDRCCNRKHGSASPDKPWRQSPVQSPKKTSPTGKKAHRSPSSSPERAAPIETKPTKKIMQTITSPTTRKTVESTIKKTIIDRSSTATCVKTPERAVTSKPRSSTTPIKTETNRFQRKPVEVTKPVASPAPIVRKSAIQTYQRTQESRKTTTTATTVRQPQPQQKQNNNAPRTNGRSVSGSKIVEKAPKEVPKVTQTPKEPAPAVTISKPVESEEESGGVSTEEDETVTELEDIRYSSNNLLDTEDEENSSRRLLAQGQTHIQQLSRDSSPDGRPQRFADRVSEPESDFESTKRERTPLEVVVPPGGLDGLREEEDEDEEKEEPALLSVADKANIFLTTDLGKVEKKKKVFETNKAVSLGKALFERTEEDKDEARKKYERDILSRPSVFSKVTDRIRNFDQPAAVEPPKKEPETVRKQSDVKEPVVEEPLRAEKVAPLCEEPVRVEKVAPVVEEPVRVEKVAPLCKEPVRVEKVAPLSEEQPKASVSRASGKFGVTLRRTSSKIGDSVAPVQEQAPEEAKPAVQPAEKKVDEAVDVRQLEIMLEKATNYDERRRLRAAIRDAKKTQTIFTTTSTTKVSTTTTRRASPTRQVNGRRSVSPVKSESGRKNSSPARKQPEEVDGNTVSTPLRAAEETAKPELVKQPSTGKLDKGKLASFLKEDSPSNTSVATIKRKVSQETESVRKISAPPREANPTDSVTSSYGVGPLDESGRPLFGLRALRRTQEPAAAAAPTEVVDQPTPPKQDVTDLSGRPLFGGLRALKTVASVVQEKEPAAEEEEMPELQPSTGQLKSLVERHEQNSKTGTTVSPSSAQKPKAKLRDTFLKEESRSQIAADTQKKSKNEALTNRTSSLKAIIKRHESSQEITSAPVEPVRKISTEQVKSILKKPREPTPETPVVSSASISLRKDSIERRPGDFEQESIVEDEDGGRTIVKSMHRERNDGDTSTVLSATSRSHVSGDGSHATSHSSSTTVTSTSRGNDSPISMARVGRSGSVRALQQKFQQNNIESPEPRSFPKAGLIFRTNSFKHANNGDYRNSGADSKDVCEENAQRTEQVTEKEGSVERRVMETRVFSESSTSSNSRSFLGNNSKVTGVQDVLSRMREADNDQEEGLSCEDREAKSLLNKFLGASVLMQGIEPLLQAQSSALVSQVEKQRLAVAQEEKKPSGDDIDEVTDQAHLRRLLDAASDYDTRRQIRARLRTLMADNKVTDSSDGVADSASRSVHGELLPMAVDQLMATLEHNFNPVVNNGGGVGGGDEGGSVGEECDGPAVDSGTESGEDPRTPNSQSQVDLAPKKPASELPPEVLDEVLGALAKLQGTLQMAAGEDVEPERKEAILSLVNKLQGSLPTTESRAAPQPAPRRKKSARHTVGVTQGDLVPFSPMRPSDFNARLALKEDFEAHDPVSALTLKRPLHRRSVSQGGQGGQRSRSLLVDDPSQILFTPEQSVQIAVHKAAINKQLSQEEDNRRKERPNREGSVEAELSFPDSVVNEAPQVADLNVDKMMANDENYELKAPEMVKEAAAKPKPVPVVPAVPMEKKELPKPTPEKPVSKPIFATQDPPKPVFCRAELPRPPMLEPQKTKPKTEAKPLFRPPSEPPKVKPVKALALELESQEPEEAKSGGVLWGSICQSARDDRKLVSRAEKKRKLKRANTIDIPKPLDAQDLHDSDEDEDVNAGVPQKASLELPFVAKTDNDRKFLAFLDRKSPKEGVRTSSAAPGGHQWNNRFSNLKTNFEKTDAKKLDELPPPAPAVILRPHEPKSVREHDQMKRKSSLPTVSRNQPLPWASAGQNVVVVGSLTVKQNQNVQQKKQLFADTKPKVEAAVKPPPEPNKEDQLMEMQRQQQLRFVQQKEAQERYRRQQESVRGPAPVGNFHHAPNSAFRPLAKQKPPQATTPRIEYSASVATETRQLNMRIYNKEKEQEPEVQEVEAPPTMMTAVSRVKEGPRSQQATVVHGQVQHRDSPSRNSLAKSHLRSILPDSPFSLARSSHSTSDMLDAAFQARFDSSQASSRCSTRSPPDMLLPAATCKLEFPLHHASPLPFSPPTQRRGLCKSESSHQIGSAGLLSVPTSTPPMRRSPSGAKIHLFSKQYEAQFTADSAEDKQRQVLAYLGESSSTSPASKSPARSPRAAAVAYNRQDTLRGFVHDDDLENVDEEFERLFESAVRPRATQPPASASVRLSHSVPSSPTGKKSEFSMKTSSSTSTIQLDGGTKISSVSSTMTSNTRVSKAPPSKLKMSPFDKFRQLDEQNSSPSPSTPKTPGGSISGPLFKFTDAGLNRSASNVKERLLYWCQVKTKEYKDLKIENFSTSWNNGMAFCALIHHFCPDAFNYEELRPENRRKNFELAFRVAEEKADIAPLLDVDDMVMMKKPDWKCVFTYVQSIYRRFKDED